MNLYLVSSPQACNSNNNNNNNNNIYIQYIYTQPSIKKNNSVTQNIDEQKVANCKWQNQSYSYIYNCENYFCVYDQIKVLINYDEPL